MTGNQLDEEAIFKVAREIQSPEARASYLQQVCIDDFALRERVVALLRVQSESPDFLESPAAEFVAIDQGVTEKAGGRIGRYKLLQALGEGGMGVVFMAEQTEPVERRVALKVVKPGMDTRQVIARFEAERQALALMDHAHIARVLDAGTTGSGRPYFVMELVRGIPITEYCDQHQLPPNERLKLFLPVCHAVQHAHQKGVIHRDLKPSNVLVAEYDEEPVAKIIDFGVAKAVGQRLTEKTVFTQIGQLVGTVDYMSPEQAKLNQLDVDTRTDIYSLGVLLYELLTGETPFEKKRLQAAAFDEMLRIVREEEPLRPSTRLSSSSTLPSISARRHTEPTRLPGLVRGELDWIVMKALEKDRARRYQTANALALDLQRYLADEPVLACPPSAAYRFHKFARRNQGTLIAAASVFVALLLGTIVSTFHAIRATDAERHAESSRASETVARRTAERERNEAQKQREQATANLLKAQAAVNESFTMVSESKLLDAPGLQPLRKDLLEAALRYYKSFAVERSNDPRVMADLALTYLRISQIDSALDRNDDAIAAVEKALDVIDRLRREHPNDRGYQLKLAGFCTERRWTKSGTDVPGDAVAAIETMMRLKATWEQLAAEEPTVPAFQADLATINGSIGALLHWSGHSAASAPFFQNASSIGEKLAQQDLAKPKYRAALADVSLQSAAAQSAIGNQTESLALTRRAVELNEELVASFPDVTAYRSALSASLVQLGDRSSGDEPEQAEKCYRRAIELSQALLAEFPGHRLYRENWMHATLQLGVFLYTKGDRDQADQIFQGLVEKISLQVVTLRKDASARRGLADNCFYLAQRVPEVPHQAAICESLYQMALGLAVEAASEQPDIAAHATLVGYCHDRLGLIRFNAHRLEDARHNYESAKTQFENLLLEQPRNEEHRIHLGSAYQMVSTILELQGRLPEALDAAERAVTLEVREPAHQLRLLEVLSETHNVERRQEALAVLKPLLHDKPSNALAWRIRGRIHAELGQTDEAVDDFIQALDVSDADFWSYFAPRKILGRELAQWPDVFENVAQLRPHEPALWMGRGQYRALRGQWAEAADDYAKVIYSQSPSDDSVNFAALLVLLGEGLKYQQFCREMVARADESQGTDAYNLARICSIGQPERVEPSRIVEWAERGLGDRWPWTLTALAMAETRAGQFESAARHFQESNSSPRCQELMARNYFGLAIVQHRLGQIDAARKSLDEARRLFQFAQPAKAGGPAHLNAAGEWIELHVLSRTVEALFETHSSSTAETAKNR